MTKSRWLAPLTFLSLGVILSVTTVAVLADEEEGAEYRKRAGDCKVDDAAGHYRLALWAQSQDMKIEARRHFRIVVTLDADHRAARRALGFEKVAGRWVRGKEAMRAKGFVQHDGVWMTPEEYSFFNKDEIEAQRAKAARIASNAALKKTWNPDPAVRGRAMKSIEALDAKYRLRPLSIAARVNRLDVRQRAVDGLATLGTEDTLPALYKRAIFDQDEAIRKAAAEAIKAVDAEGKLGPFVRALNSPFTKVRTHAVNAMEVLADSHAVGPLIRRYQLVGGSGQRVYISNVTQISFIQDFDVEVAQTSFIADPVIGVIQEGLTLDIRVLSTVGEIEVYERPALSSALSSLTGKNLGDDPKAWGEWYFAEMKRRRAEARQERHDRLQDNREKSEADG